jgi:hypothetical protein
MRRHVEVFPSAEEKEASRCAVRGCSASDFKEYVHTGGDAALPCSRVLVTAETFDRFDWSKVSSRSYLDYVNESGERRLPSASRVAKERMDRVARDQGWSLQATASATAKMTAEETHCYKCRRPKGSWRSADPTSSQWASGASYTCGMNLPARPGSRTSLRLASVDAVARGTREGLRRRRTDVRQIPFRVLRPREATAGERGDAGLSRSSGSGAMRHPSRTGSC